MKTIILRSSPLEEKELSSLLMRFKRVVRVLTSSIVICSILLPDISRAMNEEENLNFPKILSKTQENITQESQRRDISNQPSQFPSNTFLKQSDEVVAEEKKDVFQQESPPKLSHLKNTSDSLSDHSSSDNKFGEHSLSSSPNSGNEKKDSQESPKKNSQNSSTKTSDDSLELPITPRERNNSSSQTPSSQIEIKPNSQQESHKGEIHLVETKDSASLVDIKKKQEVSNEITEQKKEEEKKKEEYTEKTPLLLGQKTQQALSSLNKDNTCQKTEELKILNKGSINNGNEYPNFEEEEELTNTDGKEGNHGLTDSLLFSDELLKKKAKKSCCCNRPCLPHPDLYWLKVSDLQNVIEISENDKFKETKEDKKLKTIDLPNVTDNFKEKKSSQPLLIILNEEKQDLPLNLYIEKLKKFDFSQLSAHTKTQLNFINREIEGPWPKWEWIKNKQWGKLKEWAKNELPGAAIGTGVGAWLAPAMVYVYGSAQTYLVLNFVFAYEKPWKDILDFTAQATRPYVISSTALDAVPRNVVVWRKGLTLLKEEKVSKKRVFWTAAASFFPSLLEPSYLVLLELELIGIANSEGGDSTPYKKEIYKYTWPLFMDSWTSNFQTTWNMWDDFQEWRQTTSIGCLRSTYIPSEEESLCRDFKKKLDKVSKWLYRTASAEKIKTIYEKLKRSEQEVEELFPNLKKEDLSNARAFLGLNELLSLGDELEQTQRYIKSWYDIGVDITKDFCLVTGSPYRLLTLQLIISSMTSLIPMPSWLRHPLNWGLAGAGFIPQTALEHQGLSTFGKEFLAQEEPDGEAMYKNAKGIGVVRGVGKAYALWQGFIFTLPLVVTVFQVVNNWSTTQPGNPYWMIGAVTFLFAEYATQVSKQWSWSFQKWVSSGSTLYNSVRNTCGGSPLSTQHQRAYILGFIQNAKDRMPYFTPELLHILQGNLDYKNELEKEEEN